MPEFDWDDDKATANWRDHGVAFHEAIRLFRDAFAVERIDDREDYGEERINLIGMCDGVLIHVPYTERDHRLRIISARRAERHEQDDYYRENSPSRQGGESIEGRQRGCHPQRAHAPDD